MCMVEKLNKKLRDELLFFNDHVLMIMITKSDFKLCKKAVVKYTTLALLYYYFL